ncbi:MAG: ABC transporter substrate-binding protein [Actinomycetaceae bacterium]
MHTRTRRSTTRGAMTVAAVATLTLAACTAEETADPNAPDLDGLTHDELVAAATEEGEVVVYSFTSRIAAIEEAFEAEYPGIDLVANDISSTEQVARLAAEDSAGSATADVAYISDGPVVLQDLVEPGILTAYVPPRVADALPEEYTSPLVANRLSTKVLLYNEDAHPDGPPVSNLWELTEPEWTGRVIMVDPNVRGDYLDLMTEIVLQSDAMAAAHEEHFGSAVELDDGITNAGEQWIADLYANDLVLVDDTDAVNSAVGAVGQANPPVGFSSYSDLRDNEEEGWALQVAAGVGPSPGIAFPAYLGLVRNAENPAAARLFIDFAMGDDSEDGGPGYAPLYVPGDYPTLETIVPPEGALPLDELGAWIIDPEQTITIRRDVADLLISLE